MAKPEETAKAGVKAAPVAPKAAPKAGAGMTQTPDTSDVKVEAGDVAVTIVAAELKPFIGQALGGKKLPENAELPGAQDVLVDQNAMSKTGVSFNLMFPKPKSKGDEITEEDKKPENVRKGVNHGAVAGMLDKAGYGALADQVDGLGKGLQLDQGNQMLGVTMRNNLDRRSEQALKLAPGSLGKLDHGDQKAMAKITSGALQANPKLAGFKPEDRELAAQKLNATERAEDHAAMKKGDPNAVTKVEVQLPKLHMPKHREQKLAQTSTLLDQALDGVDPRQLQQPGGRQPGRDMSALGRDKFALDGAAPKADGPAPKAGKTLTADGKPKDPKKERALEDDGAFGGAVQLGQSMSDGVKTGVSVMTSAAKIVPPSAKMAQINTAPKFGGVMG